MKSKTSLFNKGILLNDLKRFSWISVVYLLGLLITMPLHILMEYSNRKMMNIAMDDYNYIRRIFYFDSPHMILILVIPVVAAVFLFSYMQSKKSADLYHSMPVKREVIFDTKILSGFIIILMPIIINALVCIILKISLNLGKIYTINHVLMWLKVSLILNIIIFLASVFVGMNTGNSIAQGVLTYIFLFLPVGLLTLLSINLPQFIYGFAERYCNSDAVWRLSPLAIFDNINIDKSYILSNKELIIYILISVVFYILSKYIYKIRKTEAYTNIVSFNILKPMFKYGMTFCFMLVGTIVTNGNSIKWIIFGYFLCSLIGYVLAEIILKKSIYAFKNIKGYFIYIIAMVILFMGINMDLIGYESNIPTANNVKSVYFNEWYTNDKNNKEYSQGVYKEKENIEKIIKFHQKIITDKKIIENNKYTNNKNSVYFVYKLNNNKNLIRQYEIPKDMYDNYYKDIYESMEYKKNNYKILTTDISKIKSIELGRGEGTKPLIISKSDEIKEITDILKYEVTNIKYEQLTNGKVWSNINVQLIHKKDENLNFDMNFNKDYIKLETWLNYKGYLKNTRIMKEDVKKVVVGKTTKNKYNVEEIIPSTKTIIEDKVKIELILRNSCDNFNEKNSYIVFYYLNDGSTVTQFMDNKILKEIIKN